MKLYIQCHQCSHKSYINGIVAGNRVTFAQQIHSKHLDLMCGHCGTLDTYSVNDVYAEDSASILGVVVLALGFFSTIFIGAIGTFIGCLAALFMNAVGESVEATCVRKFNTSVV